MKYERKFVWVSRHMDGELPGPATLRTEPCPLVQISWTEKYPEENLSGPLGLQVIDRVSIL